MVKGYCVASGGMLLATGVSLLEPAIAAARSPLAPPVPPPATALIATTPLPWTGFTASQKAALTALDIPVVIPNYVPAQFRVTQVNTNLCKPGTPQRGACREGSSYTLVYQNPQKACVIVSAIAGGVGGGAAEFEWRTRSPRFGEVLILFGQPTGANQAPPPAKLRQPQPNLGSFPARLADNGRSPYYSVTTGDSDYYRQTYRCGKNTSITPLDLEKIIQSLYVVK